MFGNYQPNERLNSLVRLFYRNYYNIVDINTVHDCFVLLLFCVLLLCACFFIYSFCFSTWCIVFIQYNLCFVFVFSSRRFCNVPFRLCVCVCVTAIVEVFFSLIDIFNGLPFHACRRIFYRIHNDENLKNKTKNSNRNSSSTVPTVKTKGRSVRSRGFGSICRNVESWRYNTIRNISCR